MHKCIRPLAYFAAPLFSEAELTFNLRVTDSLEKHVDVYLPQRDGGKLVDLVHKGVPIHSAYRSIFDRDVEAIRECDLLVISLDGRAVDDGAAFELGLAFALGKKCVALQTDPRRLLPIGNNPMIQCAVNEIFHNINDMQNWVAQFAAQLSKFW